MDFKVESKLFYVADFAWLHDQEGATILEVEVESVIKTKAVTEDFSGEKETEETKVRLVVLGSFDTPILRDTDRVFSDLELAKEFALKAERDYRAKLDKKLAKSLARDKAIADFKPTFVGRK